MADANHIASNSEALLRRCYKCLMTKSLADFSVCNGKTTTLCKPCKRVQSQEYRAKNLETIQAERKAKHLAKKAAAMPKRPLTRERLKDAPPFEAG